MSQGNSEDTNILSGDEAVQDEKLVPVLESIRYRKRAQSAEKKVTTLESELAKSKSENEQLAEKLNKLETEQKLVKKLLSVGVNDMEAAVLITKARMETEEDAEMDSVVEQLKKEKQYLFVNADTPGAAARTAGVKMKTTGGRSTLEGAANKAAATGSRADLQEYLKIRRSYA